METQGPPQPKADRRVLLQMSIPTKREGKGPHFKDVRIYSKKDPKDPRPFVAEDLDGNEVQLEPNDQFVAEKTILGTAAPETLMRLEEQEKKMKVHSKK